MEHSIHLLHWFGPFSSSDQLKVWEQKRTGEEDSSDCYLYLLKGKKPGMKKDSFYCGMAYKQYVWQRLKNANHHIHDIEGREHEIWVCAPVSKSELSEDDVRLCEKFLISVISQVVGKNFIVDNATNFHAPKVPAAIVNEWHFPNGIKRKRVVAGSPAAIIPDVIVYDSETKDLKGAGKLHDYGRLY